MRKNESIDNFKSYLTSSNLPGRPSVKVNGSAFPHAVIAVDFGTPIEPVKLTSEQNSELAGRMKELTTSLTGRRNVRINYDNNNGVYWASV